jgi:hypothetical protein
MNDRIDVLREVSRWLRHWSRSRLVLPPLELLPVRRQAASIVSFLNLNPDLLDPGRHPGRLERLLDYSFHAADDDFRYHSGQALGAYLRERENGPLLDRLVVRLIAAYATAEDPRSGSSILALASERPDSWVRARLEDGPLSGHRLNIVDMARKGHVAAEHLDIGMNGSAEDRLWFLERASKISHGHLLAEDATLRAEASALVERASAAAGGSPAWFVRALAADLAACARGRDGVSPEVLFSSMFADPEPEVRVRLRHAWAAWALDGGVERECECARKLVYEIAGKRQDGELRYANGAIVDLLEPLLPARDPEVAFLVEGVLRCLHDVGRSHPSAYHRKTAVKVAAKLACRWMRRSPDAARFNVAFVLSRLSDPEPVVLEEVFLSVSKRGWPELLDGGQLDLLARSLESIVRSDDPALLCSLAAMLPEFLERSGLGTLVDEEGRGRRTVRPASVEPVCIIPPTPEAAVEAGASKVSLLVSLLCSELPEPGFWLAGPGIHDLLSLGGHAGAGAARLYRHALSAARMALGKDLTSVWDAVRDLALAAGPAAGAVLHEVIPAARKVFGDELPTHLDGIVRMGKQFEWTRKPPRLFIRALSGAREILDCAGGNRWPELVDLVETGGKHGYKLVDNMAFLVRAARPGEAGSVLDTALRLVLDAPVPYEAAKRYNLVVWLLREWDGDPAIDWPAFSDALNQVARSVAPDRILLSLDVLPGRMLGEAGPRMVFAGAGPAV